jgi:predicted O-methyltransferase YrrM
LALERVAFIPCWDVRRDRDGGLLALVSSSFNPMEYVTDLYIDINEKSFQFASQNVQLNGLQNRIKLLQTQPDDPLIPLDAMGFEK